MKLNELSPAQGSTSSRKRVGRGLGCTKGKTCGSGHKGQKARTGVAIKGFEGGQMPIFQRLPKRGFVSLNRKEFKGINLGVLQELVEKNVLDPSKSISKSVLADIGLIKNSNELVKLLGKGKITSAIKIDVDAASASAKDQIERAKGAVNILKAS